MLNRVRRESAEKHQASKKPDRGAVLLLVILVAVTAIVFGAYRSLLNYPYFEWALIAYMVLTAGFLFAYVIYNRGFFHKRVTVEMLPEEWSDEKKKGFVEEGDRRRKKSRWLIIPIFAFLFTFAFDVIELFVIPFFTGLLFG